MGNMAAEGILKIGLWDEEREEDKTTGNKLV